MKRLALILLIIIAGCGSGPVTPPVGSPHTPPPIVAPNALLVVGNSITYHKPAPGWSGNWGMAASAESKDFAHLTATGLGLPLTVLLGTAAEKYPADQGTGVVSALTSAVTPRTVVVLKLGENVNPQDEAAFAPVYDQMAAAASDGHTLICLSTYWQRAGFDAVLRKACEAHGGKWVNIGDIFTDPSNPDYQGPPAFADHGIQIHPHDWSMAAISKRIVSAMQ